MVNRLEAEKFLKACIKGDFYLVETLADAGPAVIQCTDAEGNTGLHLSSWKGHLNIVKFLLNNHASPNARNSSGMTPLHLACSGTCHKEVVAVLLGFGADPLLTSCLGVAPVDVGAACAQPEVLQLLLATIRTKAVDLNSVGFPDTVWKLPFLSSACLTGNLDSCRALLHFGVDVNSWDALGGTTPLMLAAAKDDPAIVDFLLEWGADANVSTETGLTAADFASFSSNPAFGLSKKVAPNSAKGPQQLGIIEAIKCGDILAVQKLLGDGVSVDTRSDEGATPMMYAAVRGRLDLVQLLVGYGGDTNAQDTHSGWTSLMQAIFHGKFDIAKYLIQVGCDVTVQAFNGCTAIDLVYMVEAEQDDLEFIHLLSKVYQKQTDAKIFSGKKERRLPQAWTGPSQSAMENFRAWWAKMADRFRNIKWSKSVQLNAGKVGDIGGEKPKQKVEKKVKPHFLVVESQQSDWQHATLSPFPDKKTVHKGMRGLVSNSAGFRHKKALPSAFGDTIFDSGVGSLPDRLMPVYPPLLDATVKGDSVHVPAQIRRGSTGSLSGMILKRPSKSAWKTQSKSLLNLAAQNTADNVLASSWRSVQSLKAVLKQFSLDSYLPLLKEHEVDLDSLKLLEKADVEEMGVKPEDVDRFLAMISDLNETDTH